MDEYENDDETLNFKKNNNCRIYSTNDIVQTEDGNFFYFRDNELYVSWKQETFSAKLSNVIGDVETWICGLDVDGNAVYFVANLKIYIAEFDFPRVYVTFVRDLKMEERLSGCFKRVFYTMVRDGTTYAHRISQDPEKDGINTQGRILLAMAGGMIFYEGDPEKMDYWLCELEKNVYLVAPDEHRMHVNAYARDGSLVYVSNGSRLAIIREGAIEPLPFNGPKHIDSIVGVFKGEITVVGGYGDSSQVWTAKLKDIECPRTSNEIIRDEIRKQTSVLKRAITENTDILMDVRRSIDEFSGEVETKMEKLEEMLAKISLRNGVPIASEDES